jgi:hypothetical protein
MDIATLVQEVTPWLVAAAPYLLTLSKSAGKAAMTEVAKEATTKLGGGIWGGAKAVWNTLQGSDSKIAPEVVKAIQNVAEIPDDPDTHAVLRVQLRRILSTDSTLKDELIRIIGEVHEKSGASVIDKNRNVEAGGNLTNSTIVTGNENIIGSHNTVQRDKH